jgi:hypothetical protein
MYGTGCVSKEKKVKRQDWKRIEGRRILWKFSPSSFGQQGQKVIKRNKSKENKKGKEDTKEKREKETWRERNDSLGQHIIKEKRKKERKKPFLPFTKYTFDKFII